jgi:glutathione S-transferase
LGENYSVADPYLFTMSDWLDGIGIDIADYPKVADHYRRMKERPAVQRAIKAEASAS